MTKNYQTIALTNEGTIWRLTIQRPEVLNALSALVLSEISDAIRTVGDMSFDQARALIVTGAGEKAFVAGADIKEISELAPGEAEHFAKRGQDVFYQISTLKIPVIAAVNGFALGGGCELALACDFIIAAEGARFGLPEVTLGLLPGFGGTVRMPRAVGLRRAREIVFTGDMITAAEALEFGLVNHVVPVSQLLPKARAIADKISQRAPLAVANAKRSIAQTWDLEMEAALGLEARCFSDLFLSADVAEGTKAFLAKRKPQFTGR